MTWSELKACLMLLTEAQLLKVLETERKGDQRTRVLIRVYGRYSKLRKDRETKEIFGGGNAGSDVDRGQVQASIKAR